MTAPGLGWAGLDWARASLVLCSLSSLSDFFCLIIDGLVDGETWMSVVVVVAVVVVLQDGAQAG